MAKTKQRVVDLGKSILLPDTLTQHDILKEDKLMKWFRSLKDIKSMMNSGLDVIPIYNEILPDALAMAKERDFLWQLYSNLAPSSLPKEKRWSQSVGYSKWNGVTTKEFRSRAPFKARRVIALDLSHLSMFGNETVGRKGTIPSTLGDLTKLRKLNLCYNFIKGSIPSSIVKLGELTNLRLEYNQITGILPKGMEGLKKLDYLAINNNKLEGGIGESTKLTALKTLYIHENIFSGDVPEDMTKIAGLKTFYFYGNKFNELKAGPVKDRVNSEEYDWRDKA